MIRYFTLAFVLLAAAPVYGQTVKCLKPDGTEEPCASREPAKCLKPDGTEEPCASRQFGSTDTTFLGAEHGGRLDQHIERWKALAASGEDVEIRDFCPSACTLVLAHIPKERLCFSTTAVLGFHHATFPNGEIAMDASRTVFNSYPQDIRMWLTEKGGLEKLPGPNEGFWTLVASELWQMGYRKCEGPRPRFLR
jgi:hypothetical protein